MIGYVLETGVPWRWALAGTGIIWLLYGVIAAQLYDSDRAHPAPVVDASNSPAKTTGWRMMAQGPFVALFLIAFIYNGVAYSLLVWIAVFMQTDAGLSAFFSINSPRNEKLVEKSCHKLLETPQFD